MRGHAVVHRLSVPRAAALISVLAVLAVLSACAAPRSTGGLATPGEASQPGASPAKTTLPVLVPTGPPERLESAERFAWQTVTQMGEALEAGKSAEFLGKVSPGFYGGFGALETALVGLVDATTERRIVVAVQEVESEGAVVSVRATWTRSLLFKDGTRSEGFGETVFVFLKQDSSLRLIKSKGDPIFGIEGR